VLWPCYYGVDFATRDELIAVNLSTDEIAESIGADTLAYVSLDELTASTEVPSGQLCRACFDGVYPLEIDTGSQGKHMLEKACGTPEDSTVAVGGRN